MINYKNIDEIIQNYNLRVHGIIRKFTNSDNDIEDIRQEVFIKTWKNLSGYKGQVDFWNWISKITVNTCKDHLRSNKKIIVNTEDELIQNIQDTKPCPENTAIISERQKLILNSINKLKPKFRDVLILHDIDELTYEEIAKKVKCPVGTVKSRLFNARKALKEELQVLINQ